MTVVSELLTGLSASAVSLPTYASTTIDQSEKRNDRLRNELMELQDKYDTLSQRIVARDKEIGRTLDLVRKQILEEERVDWAKEREHVASRMTEIETTLSGVSSQGRDR